MTLAGLRGALHLVPVATPVASPDGSLFQVVHAGHAFPLSVVSACSGINGVVGFLLIGAAFGAVVEGPVIRKALWLVGGMVVSWAVNVGRLVFIFWAGRTWGEHVAIDILHPFVGLVTFALGIVLMLVFLRPMGLGIARWGPPSGSGDTSAQTVRRSSVAVPKVYAAIAVVLVSATVLGLADSGLRVFNVVATAAGEAKLLPYKVGQATPAGWRARLTTEFDWARPLFGDDSTWNRYALVPSGGGGDLPEQFPVTADVINTGDLQSFSAYGIEACYQFHGFTLRDVAQVDLGGGITGQTLSYSTAADRDSWSIVYWIVPVRAGTATRYERVVLYVLDGRGSAPFRLPERLADVKNLAGTLGTQGGDAHLLAAREFLAAFARELIHRQASPTHGHVLADAKPPEVERAGAGRGHAP
jgi:exosortase/archaeosortase family protein